MAVLGGAEGAGRLSTVLYRIGEGDVEATVTQRGAFLTITIPLRVSLRVGSAAAIQRCLPEKPIACCRMLWS